MTRSKPPRSTRPAEAAARPAGEAGAAGQHRQPQPAGRGRKVPRKVTAQSLDNAALFYLARFSAPSAQLRRVLLRRVAKSAQAHGTDPAEGRRLVEDLIERYRRAGLLDDEAYAAGKARSLRRRGASRTAIGRALRAKGLTGAESEAALAGLAAEGGDEGDGELAAAARLARRKRLGPFSPTSARLERRQRDLAALARAGFAYAVACRVIDAASPDDLPATV